MKIFFIGDAEDFHVVDKFNQATQTIKSREIFLFSGISIERSDLEHSILNESNVIKYDFSGLLFSAFLKNSQLAKNVFKASLYPLQIILLKYLVWRNSSAVFHAFTMYYAVLCLFTRLQCVVTPQGSEVLQRLDRSRIYRFCAIKALRYATAVIVDSIEMQTKLSGYGVQARVFKNGFDTQAVVKKNRETSVREAVVSIRALRPLYRIDRIFDARDRLPVEQPLQLVYPGLDFGFRNKVVDRFIASDNDLGRLDKNELYALLCKSKLVISIPETDSSPRSVYESIFAGAAVAVTKAPYLDELPCCMKERIIVIDLEDRHWLDGALEFANAVAKAPYVPSEKALSLCDSGITMKKICDTFYC